MSYEDITLHDEHGETDAGFLARLGATGEDEQEGTE